MVNRYSQKAMHPVFLLHHLFVVASRFVCGINGFFVAYGFCVVYDLFVLL
jgi:hypothetical protein